jgi:hypothetical protein
MHTRSEANRSFVEFILEPLYKIHSYVLGSQGRELGAMLEEIGVVRARPSMCHMNDHDCARRR